MSICVSEIVVAVKKNTLTVGLELLLFMPGSNFLFLPAELVPCKRHAAETGNCCVCANVELGKCFRCLHACREVGIASMLSLPDCPSSRLAGCTEWTPACEKWE